ncbi:MAG TPA: hypothetical protein VHI52_10525, partial [Verrucomicrobiae bacterium]|nr:hypothetical protein [Verrucomicrobiae bacterium]
ATCELPKGPKNAGKRLAFLQQQLSGQEEQLRQDSERYVELVEKGAEALSDYDRNIAHGGDDDMAWASAIALKFNHIRYGKARILALRKALVMSQLSSQTP